MKLKKFEKEIETILKDYEVYIYVEEFITDENTKYLDITVVGAYEEILLNVTIKSNEKEEFLKVLKEITGRFDFSFWLEGGLEDLKEFLEATKIALSCYKFH